MGRHVLTSLIALLVAAGLTLAGPTGTASAQTSGPESAQGFLIATGASGARVVLATEIRLSGAFNGVGKIVEVPNLPTDPANVNRDDLVFPEGTLHLVSANQGFQFGFDPRSCRANTTIQQVTSFEGGTGLFSGATGTGTGAVEGQAILQRAPDGSCSTDMLPAHEMDNVSGTGTLTF
jgi:hypothetical protein